MRMSMCSRAGRSPADAVADGPTVMGPADFIALQPRQLPLDGNFRPFNDLPVGEMPANTLIDYLDKTSGFGKTARELRTTATTTTAIAADARPSRHLQLARRLNKGR